jgi:hypothetical protein
MMTRIARHVSSLLAISAVFLGGFAIAEGCGSDSFTASPSTDGGSASDSGSDTAVSGGDAGVEAAAPGCLTAPANVPASDVAFCNAFAEIYSNCGSCEACRLEDVDNCAAIGDTLSDSFKSALVACKDTLSCDDLQTQDLSHSDCLTQQAHLATPTTQQLAVKTAYCDGCGDAGSDLSCDDFFFLPDGGGSIATAVLDMNDTVAGTVATKCGKSCGTIAFEICEAIYYCGTAPKTQCSQGLCK